MRVCFQMRSFRYFLRWCLHWVSIMALNIIVMKASNEISLITTAKAVPAAGGCSTSRATISIIAKPMTSGYSAQYGILV